MPSSFFGLNIAKSGMSTYNVLLNTTAHNVSNVKTPGYTRQTVKQSATEALSLGTSYGMVGSGVEATDIVSQRDAYYDGKYRESASSYGKYDTMNYYMQSIQDALYAKDTSSGGMTNSLDSFFKSLVSLTTDVSSTTIRKQVVGYADTLESYINETASTLQTLQKDVNGQIASTVDQINAYGEELASLTKQINTLEVYGSKANDLRDQRAYILDKLSELVSVDVVEKAPAEGQGMNQYIVSVAGAILVDTYDYNRINYTSSETYNNQNDIDNLYELTWSTGQDVDVRSGILGGKLQGLFELRDGNNGEVFKGKVKGTQGDNILTVTDPNEMGSSLFKLDIPPADGVITIGNSEYEYSSFDVSIDNDGKYTYTFHLKKNLGKDYDGETGQVGDSVDYRGIPYYMSQLNEFIRTFSKSFNAVQVQGQDMDGNTGDRLFIATDKATGVALDFSEDVTKNYTFSSVLALDADGKPVTQANGRALTSYYTLTAINCNANQTIVSDSRLLACGEDVIANGIEDSKNLTKMLDLQEDTTMFRQGAPGSFLRIMTSTVGVDGKKVKTATENAENIKNAVDNRRLSTAGVDEDEEAQNLIVCQNLLNYQYKVLSVMNEVLDKLINGTAV